jgi:hypothetical protein
VEVCRIAPANLDKRTTITIGERTFDVEADDLEKIADLGRGAYGIVEKMRHVPSGTIMAVKRIAATVNTQEQKRLLTDLDIFDAQQRLSIHRAVLWGAVSRGRRLDLHGGDGHESGQVLRQSVQARPQNTRKIC